MASESGITAAGNYAGAATNKAKVDVLIALIADVDTLNSSGATAGGHYLDQMSPSAAVGLRAELEALKASIVNV